MREKNKKAAEMTIGTIIIIVLALVVLVILVYGFSTGWTNLWEKITAFGGGKVNVQTVVQSCQLACTTGSRYDWCTLDRKVTFDNTGDNNADNREGWKCAQLVSKNIGLEDCDAFNCVEECTSVTLDSAGSRSKSGCVGIGCIWNEDLDVCEVPSCDNLGGMWSITSCADGVSDLTNKIKDDPDKEEADIACCKI